MWRSPSICTVAPLLTARIAFGEPKLAAVLTVRDPATCNEELGPPTSITPRFTKSASPMKALPAVTPRKLLELVRNDAISRWPPFTTTEDPGLRMAKFSTTSILPVGIVGDAPKKVVTGAELKEVMGIWIVPEL